MTNFHDNPFETDGSMHNIRVVRNMMINSASHAFCNQPAVGGPVYWIGNIAYHLPGGSSRVTGGAGGAPVLCGLTPFPSYSSSDYNGFRPNPGAEFSFQWNTPAAGVRADYTDADH